MDKTTLAPHYGRGEWTQHGLFQTILNWGRYSFYQPFICSNGELLSLVPHSVRMEKTNLVRATIRLEEQAGNLFSYPLDEYHNRHMRMPSYVHVATTPIRQALDGAAGLDITAWLRQMNEYSWAALICELTAVEQNVFDAWNYLVQIRVIPEWNEGQRCDVYYRHYSLTNSRERFTLQPKGQSK